MPPESIWLQFAIVSIVVLVVAVVWREMKKFMAEQDAKREGERERQRVWQEKQDELRDERWQAFLRSMQESWLKQDGMHSATLKDLIVKVDDLIKKIDIHHDEFKTSIAIMQERTKK